MCVNPLKGFLHNGVVVAVRRDNSSVFVDSSQVNARNFKRAAAVSDVLVDYIDIPCRQCPECSAAMKREWTARAIAEAQVHDKMCFLTLTYNPISVPMVTTVDDDGVIYDRPTLRHRDWQLFMYRLRQFFDVPVRFMMCGEYGSRTYRPHYHAIMYGISIDDFSDLKVYRSTKNGDILYTSDRLDLNLWQLGKCMIGDCSSATCGYVAGYVDKKFDSVRGKKFYELTGLVPPYIRSSNQPGLGRAWFDANLDKFNDVYDYVSLGNKLSAPTKIFMTEYWKKIYERNLLKEVDSYEFMCYANSKLERRINFNDHRLDNELSRSSMNKETYLKAKGRVLESKRKQKVRDF